MNHFERLKNAACEAASSAHAYVTDRAELLRIRHQLKMANEQLNEAYAELGRFSYHGGAAPEGVRSHEEIVADIEALFDTIEVLEEEQTTLLEKMNKNSTPEEESRVCEDASSLFCHKCGTAQTADSDYCRKCGTKLVK